MEGESINQFCSCSKYMRSLPIYWQNFRVHIQTTCEWCFNALTVQVPEPHQEILLRRCCCDPMSHSCRAKSWAALNANLHIEHKLQNTAKKKKKEKKYPLSEHVSLHLRVVLICRALLSILAPMSSMLFPLRSTFLRQVLLPRALTSMVPRERRRDSVRDRDCRAWRRV